MRARLLLALLVTGGIAAPASAEPPASASAQAQARKPKKEKKRKKKRSHRSRRKKQPKADEPLTMEETEVTIEPAAATMPSSLLVLGASAGMPDVPHPIAPAGGDVVASEPRDPRLKGGPTWFFGVRVGPGVIDRDGYYNFRSNRQTYHDERNVRGELTFGRYLGRHVSMGLVAGAGPFPKFDALDPIYEENTRFSVFPFHARLDLDAHAAWFVIGVGAGVAYEHTTGSFQTRDAVTLELVTHTATFKRRGITAAARTGVQGSLGPFTFEVLAEASAVKLDRGTYVHEVESPGLSDNETGYAGSLLLGVKLQ